MKRRILNASMAKLRATKTKRDEDWKVSGISRKYPTYRNSFLVSAESWLAGKQQDDGAEGLWRIRDSLYDFTDFIGRHPGGPFWLERTKGTDITEPFESHHISTVPEGMIAKYKVRDASQPRNYKLTMHKNGFYKVLKERVREQLQVVDTKPRRRSDLMHFGLLVATYGFAMASAVSGYAIFEVMAALALCWLSTAAHNYFHRRDNWQMYTFNLTLMNFCSWRISHALSHHVYPNSLHDLEMSLFEPFLCWIPNAHYASKLRRIASMILQPVIYITIFPFQFITRLIHSLRNSNVMYWHDLLGFSLPLLMLAVSPASPLRVLRQWFDIILLGGFIFGVIGLNAAHHDPEILHDGDENRSDRDWGLFQIDTIIDRGDIKGSHFMVLTHFGDHTLHHLFPTLDHGILPQLYPVLFKTLEEFQVDRRECNHLEHIIGQSKQLLRTVPNPKAPGFKRDQKTS